MTPLLDNILRQPESLCEVLLLHTTAELGPLEAAAKVVRECRGRVLVSGMGASHFASVAAAYELQGSGVQVLSMESSELLHYGSALPQKGDVAILVSRSGGSVEVVSLLPLLRERGVEVIAVSNEAESELARGAKVSLVLGSALDQMVAVQTYTATVLVLQMLAELVRGRSRDALLEDGARAIGAIGLAIGECDAAREGWRSWLSAAEPLYLLGRGASMASVQEGALLFHETAKAAAVGMSIGQFRHGPAEVVTTRFRSILFAGSERTRSLQLGLAKDLTAMGAPVMWVGPRPAGDCMQSMMAWPETLAAWCTPLLEVVPLQFAAYEMALLRGIRPGDFRYTPQVTTTEEGFASVKPVSG